MIPRRLLTVMLLLLVGLVIASAVAPPPEDEGDETARTSTSQATTTAPTTPADPDPEPADDAPVAADGEGVAGVLPRDKTVSARPGEAVTLQVTAKEAATIEIPALGAMQPAAPQAPAQFVVAFDTAGRYDVRDLEADRSVGTVVIGE